MSQAVRMSSRGAAEGRPGEGDYLDKMLQDPVNLNPAATPGSEHGIYQVTQDAASRQLQPVVLGAKPQNGGTSYGSPARQGSPRGGKRVLREAHTFAEGKQRIFGAEDPVNNPLQDDVARRGKKIFRSDKPTITAAYQ